MADKSNVNNKVDKPIKEASPKANSGSKAKEDTSKKSTKTDATTNASSTNTKDIKGKKDKPETKTIGHKKEGAWSKLWVRIVVIIIVVLVSIALIWGAFRYFSRNRRRESEVIINTGSAGISPDFWQQLEDGEEENVLAQVIPFYKDDAVIYIFEKYGFNDIPKNQTVYEDAKESADSTIEDQRDTMKKDYRGEWEDKYFDYLESLGYKAATWEQMETQWKNDLVAAKILPIMSQGLSWQTYAKQEGSATDYPWCTDTAINNICFGRNDYDGSDSETGSAKKINMLMRSAYIFYLIDYMPISSSHILIKFDFGTENPAYDELINIDATNIRNWFNFTGKLSTTSATQPFDFERYARDYSGDTSASQGGLMALQTGRATGMVEEFAMVEYAAIADQAGVATGGNWMVTDTSNKLFIDQTTMNAAIEPEIGVAYTGNSNQDTLLTNANAAGQIGRAIWAAADVDGANSTDNSARNAVYKYDNIESTYKSKGANSDNANQKGTVDYYAAVSRYGIHFVKINGLFDVTDSVPGIVPVSEALWYNNAMTMDTTVFDESKMKLPIAMGMELLREDMVAIANNPSDPGIYGLMASYNTWVATAAEDMFLRIALAEPEFLARNSIVASDDINEDDDIITAGEVKTKISKDRRITYTTSINTYIETASKWFEQYSGGKGYTTMDFDPLFTEMFKYMSASWYVPISFPNNLSSIKGFN